MEMASRGAGLSRGRAGPALLPGDAPGPPLCVLASSATLQCGRAGCCGPGSPLTHEVVSISLQPRLGYTRAQATALFDSAGSWAPSAASVVPASNEPPGGRT